MLRLPPTLRGFLASNISRYGTHVSTADAGHHDLKASRGFRHLDGSSSSQKARRYATSGQVENATENQHRTGFPPSTADVYSLWDGIEAPFPPERLKKAAAILDDLEAGHCGVEDALYEKMEKSLLLEFFRREQGSERNEQSQESFRRKIAAALKSEDPLTAMRLFAIARPQMPRLLREKAMARLHGNKPIIWRGLPQAAELWQSERLDERQKEEAAEILDIIFDPLSRIQGKTTARTWKSISKALASPFPTYSLRLQASTLESHLPQAFNQKNGVILNEMTSSLRADAASILGLFNLDRIRATCVLPSQEQYQNAPKNTNDPESASSVIHNGCIKAKLSLESESNFEKHTLTDKDFQGEPHKLVATLYFRCTLKVSIENIGVEIGYGEAFIKGEAKQAAWLHVISKLHSSGALAQIFPRRELGDQSVTQPVTEDLRSDQDFEEATDEKSPPENEMIEEEIDHTAEVDAQTLEEEKDATIEIYNYSAGLGLVPHFTAKAVQPWTPRARRVQAPKKSKPLFQVTIKVDELSINASATSKDLQVAEVAASLAFKQQAEAREGDRKPERKFRALNTDTAREFLNFCRSRNVDLTLELETQTVQAADGTNYNQATLTANGETMGQTVEMRTKKDAHAAAYLIGALEVAVKHPHLYSEFELELKKGNGRILKPAGTIDFELSPEISQTMREALVESHAAGLPASQEVLTAELYDNENAVARRRSPLTEHQIGNARFRLLEDQRAFYSNPALRGLREKKDELPMRRHSLDLLEMVNKNAYSVVIGATGSGKTTQVPQILFEHTIWQREGPYCNIICTQPRRIAATSVAQRVAEERNEAFRKSVGYHVRFDARPPYNPYGITYCTTGILLERLKHDPDGVLESTSHILIDEVHERDLYIDFLMIVLKKAIQSRLADDKKVPKVVLMSATLDTELFANYFKQPDETGKLQPAPCLSVPGRLFPVREKYLGSVVHEMFQAHGAGTRQLIEADPDSKEFIQIETDFSSCMSGQGVSKRDSVIDWKRERFSITDKEGETSAKAEKEEGLVPVGLVAATIAHVCATSSNEAAILVFLPGLDEIKRTEKMLLQAPLFGVDFAESSKFKICLLHSTLPKEQQNEIFEKSPPGCRKIILATNIAETSVTVTDIKYVVDTGKLRESRYDQLRRITKLQCVWESKSNSQQRMGRAGRVQEGFYYALFSKERADSFRAVGLPELLRSDLQETCLSIKSQKFDEPIASFLAQAIEPPSERAVDSAIKSLIATEAFTVEEELTALGRVLSSLPVHPALGKMIILGIIFKCLDPMIILGAAAEERPLFVTPLVNRTKAAIAHRSYANKAESDHLAHLEAFTELRNIRDGLSAISRRAKEQYLHVGAFRNIHSTANQIVQILVDCGLVANERPAKGENSNSVLYGPAHLNTNSDNNDLIKCLLLAGSHPNLAVKQSARARSLRTPSEATALIHPTSVIKERRGPQAGSDPLIHPASSLFAFSTLSRSNDGGSLFLRSASKVSPLMVLLFGGQIQISESDRRLQMDGWLPFKIKGSGGASEREYMTKLLLEFRKGLERVLHRAYASLKGGRRRSGVDEQDEEAGDGDGIGHRRVGFVDDPVREQFAKRVVEVLRHGGEHEMKKVMEAWSSPQG